MGCSATLLWSCAAASLRAHPVPDLYSVSAVAIVSSEKQWRILPRADAVPHSLASQLGISPLLGQLLVSRNITTPEAAEGFLEPRLSNLHSPFLMKGMDAAVERICRALQRREPMLLYGDYDVDGISGIALLHLFLSGLGAEVSFHIPDRLTQGYGMHRDTLQLMQERGIRLVITVDCGISDREQVRFARQHGIDVIITDHHEVPPELPPANAVLNPKQPDCTFPFDGLAGVGVAFNLLMALRTRLREQRFFAGRAEPNLREYLDLVALGTIADMVPLVGENRILVKHGLIELARGCRKGIRALTDICGISPASISSHQVAFRLAPRINAAGRIGKVQDSVRLLITDDAEEARQIALYLDEENLRRQRMEHRIFKEACALVDAEAGEEDRRSIVLASPAWHPGVIGICASRLLERYYKPAVLIACDEASGMGKGSARSHGHFHLYEGLKACGQVLEKFGGHHSAAGLAIRMANFAAFRELFDAAVAGSADPGAAVPFLTIDAEARLQEFSEAVVQEISRLAPFGLCNPEPTFASPAFDSFSSQVVNGGHLKLKIREDGVGYDAIGFNMAERFNALGSGDASPPRGGIRIAFIPQINEWQGVRSVQLKIKDIKRVDP
jgi:single-stranded-DNA-specific exonuclease